MSEPFIGQIYLVGYNFAQRGFAFCQGQLLPIAQNSALFSLLGTTYGGDGRTTFGLPNLAGRTAIGQGNAPGLSDRRIGQTGGEESVSITTNNMPAHSHTASLHGETAPATLSDPSNALLGISQIYAESGAGPNRTMAEDAITMTDTGGGQPVDNMMPFLVLNYEIALQGIFPSRS
ncbi:MAG: tail fiber protein [Alphaproteobacteria bacterium]|jgi:microcystin-dependent protein|nr:tail fiber protein [Alphaproteobacteria bacterium]